MNLCERQFSLPQTIVFGKKCDFPKSFMRRSPRRRRERGKLRVLRTRLGISPLRMDLEKYQNRAGRKALCSICCKKENDRRGKYPWSLFSLRPVKFGIVGVVILGVHLVLRDTEGVGDFTVSNGLFFLTSGMNHTT